MSAASNILLAYYGDDFTGSTDVMEALASNGVKCVLFLCPPTSRQLDRHPDARAFGIAGSSRAMSPDQMARELPTVFAALKASRAPIVHYKICSTFDSAPNVGSIGKAIEIGRQVFGNAPTPLVVGAPVLGRYVVFANLFARSGIDSEPSRLDRHPTMRSHPVTPMDESDLRLHLLRQTNLPVQLVDVLKLNENEIRVDSILGNASPANGPILLFDTLEERHLRSIGRIIEELSVRHRPLFCLGSSGIEYALAAHRSSASDRPRTQVPKPAQVQQVLAVSGSCSPVTARQMDRAADHGFELIALDPGLFLGRDRCDVNQVVRQAVKLSQEGRSVILHTSHGPSDPRIETISRSLTQQPDPTAAGAWIGTILGELLEAIIGQAPVSRLVVCGGDTSTCVARALGLEALEYIGPMAPGSPLCRVHAPGRAADGREIVFKGGQVGRDNFFLDVLTGGPLRD